MNSNDWRKVVDHTIFSHALPALEIAVDPTFEYVGTLSFVLKEIAAVERVIFADRQSSRTTRLFIVQFEGILDGVDFTYKYQTTDPIKLDRYDYQHGVYMYSNDKSVRESPGAESDRTTQFLQDREYSHDDGLAMSRFARIVDEAHRHEIIIFYQETLSSMGLSLERYDRLSSEEQQVIGQALTERSLRNFQVTDLS